MDREKFKKLKEYDFIESYDFSLDYSNSFYFETVLFEHFLSSFKNSSNLYLVFPKNNMITKGYYHKYFIKFYEKEFKCAKKF